VGVGTNLEDVSAWGSGLIARLHHYHASHS
jgi:hypothetical protein